MSRLFRLTPSFVTVFAPFCVIISSAYADKPAKPPELTIPMQMSAYLTPDTVNGANVLNQCEDGFHFASAIELQALSPFVYNNILGLQKPNRDSGEGPPDSRGWVRTGQPDSSIFGDEYNCKGWTSSGNTIHGVTANYSIQKLLNGGSAISFEQWPCDYQNYVWCISDAAY